MSDNYRYATLDDIVVGDVLIRKGSGEECPLTQIIYQPAERDRTVYMFFGFCCPRRMMIHIFENDTKEFCQSVYKLKKDRYVKRIGE